MLPEPFFESLNPYIAILEHVPAIRKEKNIDEITWQFSILR